MQKLSLTFVLGALALQSANAQKATAIDSLFARYAASGSPGCAVGVARGDSTLAARGYGLADLEHEVALTPQSVFYMASVSKEFTALSVLVLERDGKLRLDDGIRQYVPELPAFADGITLRHLLYHTSGLRDYLTLASLAGHPSDFVITERDFLNAMSRQSALNFAPGTEHLYSNSGYVLLSIVVQRVSGKPLDQFARERIFAPLGMERTRFQHNHAVPIPGRAIGYTGQTDRWRIANSMLDVVGDGGMYSTVDDMLRWASAFERPEFAPLLAVMQTPGKLGNGQTIRNGYGMGLLQNSYRGSTRIFHVGGLAGYRTSFMRFPSEHLSIVVLCNNAAAVSGRLSELIADRYITFPQSAPTAADGVMPATNAAAPAAAAPTPVAAALIDELAGIWYSRELEATYRFAFDTSGATLLVGNAAPIPLRKSATGALVAGGREFVLERDDRGRVIRLLLNAGRVRGIVFTKWQ